MKLKISKRLEFRTEEYLGLKRLYWMALSHCKDFECGMISCDDCPIGNIKKYLNDVLEVHEDALGT